MSLFTVASYRQVLEQKIREQVHVRGYRAQLAEAAGCQRSYLSQILKGTLELTMDQAAGMATFWGLDEDETEYFLGLVQRARAGTRALRTSVDRRLEQLRARRRDLRERFRAEAVTAAEAQQAYYAAWHLQAIHILLSVPGMGLATKLAERLGLPVPVVETALTRLESLGVIAKGRSGWEVLKHDVHLPRDAPMTDANHMNWRHRALVDLQMRRSESFHYTAVFAMARKDAERLQEMIVAFLAETRGVIKDSPSEEVFGLGVDFFVV